MREILNSPGYYITRNGLILNSDFKELKTFLKSDGYVRIQSPSIRHGKRVNFSVHLLMAETYLNGGSYKNDGLQVNHIDGNKTNNSLSNLELVTGRENVNHAHNLGLYKFDLELNVIDIKDYSIKYFRSIREFSRFINKSLNYVKTRLISSNTFPILNRYIVNFDKHKYMNLISKLKGEKIFYVYSHISGRILILNSYSQISLLLSIPYTTIGKKLNKTNEEIYYAGYTFSNNKINKPKKIVNPSIALRDKYLLWESL